MEAAAETGEQQIPQFRLWLALGRSHKTSLHQAGKTSGNYRQAGRALRPGVGVKLRSPVHSFWNGESEPSHTPVRTRVPVLAAAAEESLGGEDRHRSLHAHLLRCNPSLRVLLGGTATAAPLGPQLMAPLSELVHVFLV